jgi:hypothetical protein
VTRQADPSVLGDAGQPPNPAPAIPPPPLPAGIQAQLVPVGGDAALAVWTQQGAVHAAAYAPALGWAPAQALEQIHGQASVPQLASDGRGRAIAVWQHTVGKIRSLRFSRYETGTGWSVPDVLPGALPREPGEAAGAQLRMDAAGRAYASWPSGFDRNEMQSARFVPGQGWSRAVSQPAPAASPPQAAASEAQAATH